MVGGLMGFGLLGFGGRVRNLDVRGGDVGTVVAGFGWDGPLAGWRWWGYVDGLPVSECGPGAPFVSDPLGGGAHEVSVRAWEEWVVPIPEVWGGGGGRQVYLDWGAVDEGDVRGYRVYWDEGGGGDADVAVADVTLVELQGVDGGDRPRWALPSSGVGVGRLSVGGRYSGVAVNDVWRVKLAAGGKYQLDSGGGYGALRDWRSGVTLNLGEGLSVRFEDAAGLYEVDDVWEFRVGPRTWWVSGELSGGAHKFAVSAVDAAGNEGDASGELVVVVDGVPDPVVGVSVSYNAIAETIVIGWEDPAELDDVVIYSNWNGVFEELEEWVLDDGPLAVVSEGVEGWALPLPGGTVGEFLFYVRARKDGLEDGTSVLLRVVAEPDAAPELLDPVVASALAGPGGSLRVTAGVDLRGGVPEELALYVFGSGDPDWGSAVAEDVVAFAGVGYPVALQVIDAAGPWSGSVWVGVRARDGDGRETRNVGVVEVVADGVAPGAPVLGVGVAT